MQKEKKRKWLSYVIMFAALAILAIISVIIIQGCRGVPFNVFPRRSHVFTVDELNFDVGRGRVFAYSGGAVAAAGTFGIQVLDADGEETLRYTFRMFTPAIASQSGLFLAFDIGGTAVKVFSANQIINAVETTGQIVSATLNQNGWFTVVTQEEGAFRGTIQVYNSNGSVVYRVDLGRGFPITAMLSENNHNLAILNLTNSGSTITFYNGIDADKEEPDHQFNLANIVMFDIRFINNNEVLAISTESVLRISSTGNSTELFNFRGRRLGSFAHGDDFIALNLHDYGVGYSGQIVMIDTSDGSVIGDHRIHREVISMSSGYGSLAILQNDVIIFLCEGMEEYFIPEENAFAAISNGIIMLGENVALATGDNSAKLIRR